VKVGDWLTDGGSRRAVIESIEGDWASCRVSDFPGPYQFSLQGNTTWRLLVRHKSRHPSVPEWLRPELRFRGKEGPFFVTVVEVRGPWVLAKGDRKEIIYLWEVPAFLAAFEPVQSRYDRIDGVE
jgi:hypothetical protein